MAVGVSEACLHAQGGVAMCWGGREGRAMLSGGLEAQDMKE